MKKTFTINMNGTIFHIEEDAYEKLQGYLLKLKNHFGNEAEGREIVADIEARISELFTEKSKGENKVIVDGWVDEVIATMGTPEDFIATEAHEESLPGAARGKRRLYRDADNKVISGVCSGLGAYFKIDPVVVRILFVVLLLINGIGLLAYLVLWIAVPRAHTTAHRLEMRGEEVNISNIERSIRDDVQEAKDGTQQSALTETVPVRVKPSPPSDGFTDILKGALKIMVILFGSFLILTGFLGLLGFISTLVIGQTFLSEWPLVWSPDLQVTGLLDRFISPGGLTWGLISIALLAGIPLLAMLFVGTKLVFRYRSNNTAIGLGMVGIWLLALVALVLVTAGEAGNFKSSTSLSGTETLYPAKGKTLNLRLAVNKYKNFSELDWDMERFKVVQIDGKNVLLGEPRLDIEKSTSGEYLIIVKKRSRGKNQSDANENIQKIIYNYQVSDSTITFDPWFFLGENGKWRDQRVDITLKIPEGKAIYLNENMEDIIFDIENVSDTWERDMIGKTWIMLPEGLTMKDSLMVKSYNNQ